MQEQRTYGSAKNADQRATWTAMTFHRDFGVKDLAEKAQVPYWRAGKALGRLVVDGMVEKTPRGIYRVIREEVS